MRSIGIAIAAALVAGCTTPAPSAPLQTVAQVDLRRYAGVWHEIALYPNRFQRDCASDTSATYRPLDEARISVRNRCLRADGSEMTVDGVAEVIDRQSGAKLKVSFLPAWLRWTAIGRGDYWILHLSPDYRVAIVGEPGREYLWILARTPTLPDGEYRALLPIVRAAGYDPDRLRRAAPPR